jgi:hypothetical protein
MASRSGGYRIKTNKVRPGPDQAFTLQKGVSAAPIKGKGMGVPSPKQMARKSPTAKAKRPDKVKESASAFIKRRQQLAGIKPKSSSLKKSAALVGLGAGAGAMGVREAKKLKKDLGSRKRKPKYGKGLTSGQKAAMLKLMKKSSTRKK